MVELWGRHRRDFRSLWNNVSEGLSGKEVRGGGRAGGGVLAAP